MATKWRMSSVLAVIVSFAVLMLGCGGGNKGADGGSNGSNGTAPEVPRITFLSNINTDTEGYDVNDNPYIRYVEERNGIDLELINESTNYEQKMYTVMASGDLPDFLVVNNKNDLMMFASQGLLMPLDELLAEHPDFVAKFEPISWELAKWEGQIYGIPAQRYDPTPLAAFALRSWVEDAGIDPEQTLTIDEYYAMLEKFASRGEGTYGMTAMGEVDLTYNLFMDAFDAAKYQYIDGEVRPNYILDGYKEWLKFMNKLYANKILDNEYIVNTGTQMWEKAASGNYGMWQWFWSQIEFETAGGKREDIVALKPPKKADGTPGKYLYTSPVRHYVAITKNSKYAKEIIKLQEWITSEEGIIYEFAGVEGLDYELKDGEIVFKEGRAGKNSGWRNKTVGVMSPVADETVQRLLAHSFGELAMQQMGVALENGTFDEIKLLAPFFPELADYDLDAMVKEFRDKAIIGQIDIDKEWDNFVREWRKAGGDRFIELHTEWYKEHYGK